MKRIIAAVAAAMATVLQVFPFIPDLPDREGADIKGYVHNGMEGIAGAYVSDGFSFAETDTDGTTMVRKFFVK